MGLHTCTYRGRRVTVVLRSGETFTARFVTRTRGKVVLFDNGRRVPAGEITKFMSGANIARTFTERGTR
jgi:small nuclear ribonucleoprotein (snRNP)-like protein